ncbi:MAG: macro domain-containing protein [Acidobacteria bacterium]|nr:MAG: macro domain-containing protein [Acidobacteriota bacterium]
MNRRELQHVLPSGHVIKVVQGDITEEQVDAIVNAANEHLAHGGGVAGAIVRKGGSEIQRESTEWVRRHGPVATGQAAITGAGRLPAKAVIHAVGPVWHGGEQGEDEKLRSAVWNSLKLADERGFRSIALPAISSGIFGFPKDRCAHILLATAREFAEQHPDSRLQEIRFVLFDQPTLEAFAAEFRQQFGGEA